MKRSDGSANRLDTHALPALWRRAGLAGVSRSRDIPNVEITSLTDDSRQVVPGALFVAVTGTSVDGHDYVGRAVTAGASVVVMEREVKVAGETPRLIVEDARSVLTRLAVAFYELDSHGSRRMRLIGLTGTNGKTTVSWLLRSILRAAGESAALIGTIEYDLVSQKRPAPLTTPGGVQLCRHLATAFAAGATSAILEVSSHALEQRRTDGLPWTAGVFTNLSGDHLDYHGSMEAYARAKRRLFESLDDEAVAVVNADDPWMESITGGTNAATIRYGLSMTDLDVTAEVTSMTAKGSQFDLKLCDGNVPIRIELIGRHNVLNALAAAATAQAMGVSGDAIRAGLQTLKVIPGRLQPVNLNGLPFSVLVDYAHTDDALRNALLAVRPITSARVRCVFGCGGDRDRTKRPRMGAVVEELADVAYVTSDNPRSEDPQRIVEDVLTGFRLPRSNKVHVEVDRAVAIAQALADAQPGDTVLIAGKGHEDYQLIGDRVLHFDDVEVARMNLDRPVPAGGHI